MSKRSVQEWMSAPSLKNEKNEAEKDIVTNIAGCETPIRASENKRAKYI
jgi:hypothetical protein